MPRNYASTLVPYLRAWRLYRNLRQVDLAHKAKINVTTVISAESGRPIMIHNAGSLARVLEVSRETLESTPPPEATS